MHRAAGPRPLAAAGGRHSQFGEGSLLVLERRLEEQSLLKRLKADYRCRDLAAVHLEFAAALVQGAAVMNRNRVLGNHDRKLDVSRRATFPALYPELVLADQVGQVESLTLPDGDEPDVEPPVGTDAGPQVAHQSDPEKDGEAVPSIDDLVRGFLLGI